MYYFDVIINLSFHIIVETAIVKLFEWGQEGKRGLKKISAENKVMFYN